MSSSSNAGDTPMKKQRRVTANVVDASFDKIVTGELDQNMAQPGDALRNRQGLVTFILGLVHTGLFEEAFHRWLHDKLEVQNIVPHSAASLGCERSLPWFAQAGPPQDADEDLAKAMRIDVTHALSFVRLAHWMHKDCVLLHRCHDVALEIAVIRYTSLRLPIAEPNCESDLRKKGHHTIAGDKIEALGFGQVAGQYLSIDPESKPDVDWHFDNLFSSIVPRGPRQRPLPDHHSLSEEARRLFRPRRLRVGNVWLARW